MEKKKITRIHPLHYVINMIGMSLFPFIAAPLLKHIAGLGAKDFEVLIDERVMLVPKWMKAIMKTK